MTSRCAPRCRTRTFFLWLWLWLPVLNEPAIGEFRLLGKFALALSVFPCLVHARARVPSPAPALVDLELEHAELACGCHQRDLGSAPRAHALIEGTQRTRRPDHDPGRLAEHVASLAWPLL